MIGKGFTQQVRGFTARPTQTGVDCSIRLASHASHLWHPGTTTGYKLQKASLHLFPYTNAHNDLIFSQIPPRRNPLSMQPSPLSALDQLTAALACRSQLDRLYCRRLALRVTSRLANPAWASVIQESLCAIIDGHQRDPEEAYLRFEFLRRTIEDLLEKRA